MRTPYLILALALAACDPTGQGQIDDPDPPDPDTAAYLVQFDTCDSLRSHLATQAVEELVNSRYGYWAYVMLEDDFGDAPESDGGDGPSDYTTTNVQEQGVDEADFVKTDGEYIYVVQDGRLFIVDSWPAEDAELVGELAFGQNTWPQSMFLHEDKLLVYSSHYDPNDYRSSVRMSVIDVSDRAEPRKVRDIDVDGWFSNARMIDGDTYAIVNSWMQMPDGVWGLVWRDDLGLPPDVDWDASELEREAAKSEARQILTPLVEAIYESTAIDDILPKYQIDDGPDTLLHACNDLYGPNTFSAQNLLSVVHVDLDDSAPEPVATGLIADGWVLYGSLTNLYVAQSSRWWWDWTSNPLTTHIHQFSIDGQDNHPRYEASGQVDGWLLDQFSMSEWDGHLRVATTETDWWWGWIPEDDDGEDDGSLVTILKKEADELVEVGRVDGIAPGEFIQASRMMGDTGYLVTFERTDPLFTLDLSDPSDPEIIGELEMPGFSAYLHPLGDDHLLAVGQHGDWDGTLQGIDVTLFDVSDLANPVIADQYTFGADNNGWAWSEALWDHHAFTFHRGVLSIPAYDYDYVNGTYDTFSGLLVFEVDEDGITELGRIDHSDLVQQSICLWGDWWYCEPDEYYWYANVRRSVYIEDNLFSISNYGMKVNDLYEPSIEEASVLFHPK